MNQLGSPPRPSPIEPLAVDPVAAAGLHPRRDNNRAAAPTTAAATIRARSARALRRARCHAPRAATRSGAACPRAWRRSRRSPVGGGGGPPERERWWRAMRAASPARVRFAGKGGADQRATHPLARSGRWLSSARGRRTRLGPSFTVSRSTSLATSRFARRLLDQAVLRGVQNLPSTLPSTRKHRSRIRGSSSAALSASRRCKLLGIAAGNRGRNGCHSNIATIDPEADQRQPARAEMPLLRAARTSPGMSRSSAWPAASG